MGRQESSICKATINDAPDNLGAKWKSVERLSNRLRKLSYTAHVEGSTWLLYYLGKEYCLGNNLAFEFSM